MVRRQVALQSETLRSEHDRAIMSWAGEAVHALSDALGVVKAQGAGASEASIQRRAIDTAQHLSALADRGRLFFPNHDDRRTAGDKHAAYSGHRPAVLDALVFACVVMDRLDPATPLNGKDADILIGCRRLFVSEVQQAVDPRRRGLMMRKLDIAGGGRAAAHNRQAQALRTDLAARYPGEPQAW